MTLFQITIYSILYGFTCVLPISSDIHLTLFTGLMEELAGWNTPPDFFFKTLYFSCGTTLFVIFLHDWLSILSCFFQVIFFRKRPRSLDERIPLFLGATYLPMIFVNHYLQPWIHQMPSTPLITVALFIGISLVLWIFDYLNKKTKNMSNWNSVDAFILGCIQGIHIPGCDAFTSGLIGASMLNYRLDAAIKYVCLVSTPLLLARGIPGLKEVSFNTSFFTTFLFTGTTVTLSMRSLLKHYEQKNLNHSIFYRWVTGIIFLAIYSMKLL